MNKIEIQYIKISGTQLKQCWEGNLYLRKEGKSQINNLSSHFKNLQKEKKKGKQIKPKASRRKKITQIRAEINEIENRKTIKQELVLSKDQ